MRILPRLTASPTTVTVKKGTFPVSTRILPIAGSVATPLKAPVKSIANPILTGPYISTQERAAATKNILTSVTQKPAVGPLVLPKPYVAPKPVVQKPVVSTPFPGRPLVTPVEQQQMNVVAHKPALYQPGITPTFNAKGTVVKSAEEYKTGLRTGLDYFNRYTETVLGTLGALSETYTGFAWNKDTWSIAKQKIADTYSQIWSPPALEEAGVPAAVGRAAGNLLSLAGEAIVAWQMGKAVIQTGKQLQTTQRRIWGMEKVDKVLTAADELKARLSSAGEGATAMPESKSYSTLISSVAKASENPTQATMGQMMADYATALDKTEVVSSAYAATTPPTPPTAALAKLAQTLANPSTQTNLAAFIKALPSNITPGIATVPLTVSGIGVPVGQPVTTQQTVPPAPVRTALPAQATAPVSRILPYATEATPVSSPVATISTRQLPIAPSPAPTAQPVATATKQPYSVDLPDGSRLTITPPAATPAVQVAPAAKEPWQMTQDEYMNRRPIPAMQGKLPETGTHPAVETVDGSIFTDASDTPATHVQMVRDLGIPPERLKSGGWIVDGVYEPTARSDTMKYAEQEQAKTRVEQKQVIRRALSEGKDVPPEVLASYPDLKTSPSAAISNQETSIATPVPATAPQNVPARESVPTPLIYIYHRTTTAALEGIKQEGMTTGDFTAGNAIDFPGNVTIRIKSSALQNPQVGEYGKGVAWYLPNYEQQGPIAASDIEVQTKSGWQPLVAPATKEPWEMTQKEMVASLVAGAEPAATIPGEPFEFFAPNADLEHAQAAIFDNGEGMYYITKADGLYVKNPETTEPLFDTVDQAWNEYHHQVVQQAITEGKDVPANVLADYPDLKATAPASVLQPAVATDAFGLGTREAFDAAVKAMKESDVVAVIDMNALLTNSKQYGPDFANMLRVIVAGAMQQEGVQGYGLNKIEIAALFPSQEEADAKMAAVQAVIEETAVNATVDGKTTTLTGWRLDYGTGDDKGSADAALAASRTDLARPRWNVQPVRSPAGAATQRKGDTYATNFALGIRPEASSQQQIAKNNATPWVALGIQPTPRQLLNGVVALGYTLDDSSRQMFDPKEINRLPMLQRLFRKSGTKVIGLDELVTVLFAENGIDRPQGDMQADDWLAQQLVAGASAGAGNATTDIFGSPIRTRAVAPTEAADTELFGKGQKAAFTTAQKNAAERGRHLQGQNQRTEQVRQAPVDEGVFPGEVAALPFNIATNNNANVTGAQMNQPTTAGYEMNVTPPSGTTARTIAAENIQKVALAVKDYVTTLASHPNMKASDYHAKLQERLDQLGVPAGLFTPTEILKMYQASKGPSQLWNLTNKVLLKLNAYNTAQTLLAEALNDVPSSVVNSKLAGSLQDATLDSSDLMRSLDVIDRELTKGQVTADLREKFDDMLTAEKEKAAIRLAKMSHRMDVAKEQAEWKALLKDRELKDKATRDKAVLQINRMLSSVEKNVQSGHTIKLDYVDTIRSIVSGLTKDNKLMADAARQMTIEQLQQLAGAIKTQVAVGRIVYMADRAQREQTVNDAIARVLPNITPMAGYQTKKLNHATYTAVVSRYGRFRNAAASIGQGITPAETIHRMLGLREMYMDFLGGLTDARQITDSWRVERLAKAKELGIATDLQQRRIGIWLINQTPGGRNHMLEGNKLTEDDIDSIVLTPEEQEYAIFMQDHFDKNFPALRDYFRDFYNIEVTPVDAYTSLFNSSEFESDYEKAMKNLSFQNAVSGQRKTPKVGMAIKRTGGDNPVELNIFRIGDTYDDTLGYAMEFGPRLQKWWAVATDEEVMNKLGDLGNIYIRKNLVNLTYRGGPGGRTAESMMDKTADWLRRNLSRGQILLRPTSAMLQALQISNVVGITGQNFVVKAGALLASDEKYGEWVKQNFPLLRDSVRNYFEILGLPDDKLTQVTGAMFRWCHDAGRTTGALANYMYVCQQAGIAVDWEHPDKDLLLEAMVMVNQEFGSEDIVSLPAALETGYGFGDDKSLARLILQFQQDTLAKFDVLKTRIPGFAHKDAKRAMRSLFWMVLVGTALVAGARYGYRKGLKAVLGAKQIAADTYLSEYLKDLFEAVPFGNSIQSVFEYGDIPVPVLGTLVDAASQAKNLITYQSGYAKLRAGIRLATDIGSTLIPVPGIGTIGQALGYMVPSGSSSSGSTIPKPSKPTKPAVVKPHK